MKDELKEVKDVITFIAYKAKNMGITMEELLCRVSLNDLAKEFKELEETRDLMRNVNPDIKIIDPEWEEIKRVETAKAKSGK